MSTQAIKDYLVKQLFIAKNVVTYRSLSREFGIHVNVAKQELALYHAKAPYDSQTSFATYLLIGEVLNPQRKSRRGEGRKDRDGDITMDVDNDGDEDVGMDIFASTQTDSNSGEDEDDDPYEEEDEDYEDVTAFNVTIVNEKDLEGAKNKYHKLTSVHVYSLSPSLIHDASHICTPTPNVRKMDNSKGQEHALIVGRVVAPNIHIKPIKLKVVPTKATPAPAAESSKSAAQDASAGPKAGGSNVKVEEKKVTLARKPTGKLDFFGTTKAKKEQEKPAAKKGEAKDEKKDAKMFFGASGAKPKEKEKPAVVKQEEEEEAPTQTQTSNRGVKRKSMVANVVSSDTEGEVATKSRKINSTSTNKPASRLLSRTPSVAVSRPPSSRASSGVNSRKSSASSTLAIEDDEDEDDAPIQMAKAAHRLRVKKGVVLSDDDDDEGPKTKRGSRKEETMRKAKILAEKQAKEMMELSDDDVDHVSRGSKRPNPLRGVDDEVDEPLSSPENALKVEDSDGDVSMDVDLPPIDSEEDEMVSKPKQKRKREKKVVPIGRNGIKKRKVTKTRHSKGEDGYMQTEDYTDWESVDEEEEEEKKPKAKPKATRKTKAVKQEEEEEEEQGSKALSRAPSLASVKAKEKKATTSKATAKEAKSKPAAKPAKGKGGQGGIKHFFSVAHKS